MKRFHVHVSVASLQKSVPFYATLFGAEPAVLKPDYAKWELDEPSINFAISQKGDRVPGLNHFGIQVTEARELDALHKALGAANITTHDETCARCCYAESDKHWAVDPEGIVWETYHTMNTIAVYGEDRAAHLDAQAPMPVHVDPVMPAAEATVSCGAMACR
jgi:catechol 2,3-dioxygenase-like lactoylglutathione lyase family enzyme